MEKKYTVGEVAKELKVSTKTILREIQKGNLVTERVGRRYLISDKLLQTYLTKSKGSTGVEKLAKDYFKSKKGEMVSLLQKMVSMPSVTSDVHEEVKLARFIKILLDKWKLRNVIYEAGGAIAVRATFGYQDKGLLLDCPLDTLPPGDISKWLDPPFDGVIKSGR